MFVQLIGASRPHLVVALFALASIPLYAQDSRPETRPDSRPESRGGEVGEGAESAPTARRRPPRRGGRQDAAAASGPASTSKPAPESRPANPFLAVTDAVIYPVSGPVMRRGTVLLKDDKIVDIGARVAIPEGALVIDAKGRHLTPGLVSMSVFGAFGGGFTPRGEEKTGDQFDPYNQRMLMALSSGITTGCEGAVGGGGGGFLGGRGGRGGGGGGTPVGVMAGYIGKLTYGTIEGTTVRDGAALLLAYSGGEVLNRAQTKESLKRAAEWRKKRSEYVVDVAAGKRDAKLPPADDAVKSWLRVWDGEIPCFVQAEDRLSLEAVAELSEEFDLPITILGGREAWTIAPRLARARLRFVLNPRNRDGNGEWSNAFASVENGWSVQNAAKLSAAGLAWCVQPLGASVGTGGLMGRDLLQLNMDAAFTVRGGATEAEALRALTLGPAETLKIDDRVGSLAVGKDGDLVLMDLDPLDYRSFADVVVVNGRVVYEKDKVSFFNHVQTDRSLGLKGPWRNER